MMSVRTDLLLAVLRDTLAATVNFIMLSTANQEVYDPAELHLGDSALVVDRAAHQIFQANLLAHPGTAKLDIVPTVVGEEHPYLPDDIRDGQLLVLLDPADGSNQWRCQRAGWCTAGIVVQRVGDGWRFVTAFSAAPDGRLFLLRDDGSVIIGSTHNAIMAPFRGPTPPNLTKEHIVAANAYKHWSRHLAAPVFDALGDEWFCLTFAGNPAVMNLLTYDTDAVFNPNPSSVWDTAALIIAAHTSAVVGSIDGQVWHPEELVALFGSRVDLDPTTCQFIPPYVAAKNEDLYRQVVAAIKAGLASGS
jgi:hypothetical protein